jgi:hypothetical protein
MTSKSTRKNRAPVNPPVAAAEISAAELADADACAGVPAPRTIAQILKVLGSATELLDGAGTEDTAPQDVQFTLGIVLTRLRIVMESIRVIRRTTL